MKQNEYNSDFLKHLLTQAEAILITAGAGIGVDSGLPDFRGDEGFWKAYPPIAKLGIGFSSMANPVWFDKDPFFAWGFYGHRLNLYRNTIPHEGFKLLFELVKSKNNNYFIPPARKTSSFRSGMQVLRFSLSFLIFFFSCILSTKFNLTSSLNISLIAKTVL